MGSKNNHRGDTLSKRIARLEFYIRVRAWVGEERFTQMKFLYLASFEGGDASVLRAMGVPDENQLAVDFDSDSLERFIEKYPTIPTHLGRVEDIDDAQRFDCIFLDFCANLSEGTIAACVQTIPKLRAQTDSIFAFAIQRGREKGWKSKIEEASRQVIESTARRSMANGWPVMLGDNPHEERLADGRTSIIYNAIADEAMKCGVCLYTLTRITYRSLNPQERMRGKPGTPMIIAGYWAAKFRDGLTQKQFEDKASYGVTVNALLLKEWNRIGIVCSLEGTTYEIDEDIPPLMHERLYRLAAVNGGPMLDLVGFESQACLCRAVVNCDEQEIDPALALNLSTGSVAALRAHATRGTYKHVDDIERKRIAESIAIAAEKHGVCGDRRPIVIVGGDTFNEAVQGLIRMMQDFGEDALEKIRAVAPSMVAKELQRAKSMTAHDLTALTKAIVRAAGLGHMIVE